MLYIRKSVEKPFSAFQLNKRGLVGEDWFWDAVSENKIITHDFGKHEQGDAWCEIMTPHGSVRANTGDYILFQDGKFRVLSEYVFNELYEQYVGFKYE